MSTVVSYGNRINGTVSCVYRIDEIEINVARGCIRRLGSEYVLRYQSFQVLLFLLEHRERLVSKDELASQIWPDTAVTENALAQCIAEIRKALDDDSRNPVYIKTIPKVGYRFVAQVEQIFEESLSQPGQTPIFLETSQHVMSAEVGAASSLPASAAPPRFFGRQSFKTDVLSWKNAVKFFLPLLGILILAGVWFVGSHFNPVIAEATGASSGNDHSLAVMYFENESQRPDLDWLCQGLTDMMITDLSRSESIHVLSRQQLSLLIHKDSSQSSVRVPFDQALHIAHLTHAANVLLGSFSVMDGQYRIDVQLHDTRTGQIIFADHVIFEKPGELLNEVDILAGQLAGKLDIDADIRPNIAEITTKNVDAYRYYSLGVEKAQAFETAQALNLLKQAVLLDPQFAMAYARIGYTYAVSDFSPEEGKPYLEKALQLSDHLTAKDHLYVDAWNAIARSDYTRAIHTFNRLIDLYPQEGEAYWRLALLLRAAERPEEALQILQRGMPSNENNSEIYDIQGFILLSLRRYPEAIEAHQRYVAAMPKEPNAHDSLGMSYQQSGDYDRAAKEYDHALALDPEFEPSIIHLGDVYYQTGQFKSAIDQYQRYVSVAHTANARALGYGNLATVYLAMDHLPEAEDAAANELKNNNYAVWNSLVIALKKEDHATALRYEQILFNHIPTQERGTQGDQRTRFYYEGYIELQNGNTQKALADFHIALQHLPPSSGMDIYEDCVANTELKLGHDQEAIAEYQRILALNPNYPLVHYHLAQAYDHTGETQKAALEREAFTRSWKLADVRAPIVHEAMQILPKISSANKSSISNQE